jgi:hydrogenase-4 component E
VIYLLIVLFGSTMLYVSATSRIEAYIKTLYAQGFLLFLMVALEFGRIETATFVFLCLETLVFKAVLIPAMLSNAVRKNEAYRDVEPSISHFFSLIISTLVFLGGFAIAYLSGSRSAEIQPLYFGISISTMVNGLLIVMLRKNVITHAIGYMMMENGIFLLSLSIAKKMPFVVDLGVLLDLFTGIFLLVLFAGKIREAFDETEVDSLSRLKD